MIKVSRTPLLLHLSITQCSFDFDFLWRYHLIYHEITKSFDFDFVKFRLEWFWFPNLEIRKSKKWFWFPIFEIKKSKNDFDFSKTDLISFDAIKFDGVRCRLISCFFCNEKLSRSGIRTRTFMMKVQNADHHAE